MSLSNSFARLAVAAAALTLSLSAAAVRAGTPSELEKRGFVAVDGSQSSSGFSNLWLFNARTGQCVQLETSGGKVMTINEVTHPKCR